MLPLSFINSTYKKVTNFYNTTVEYKLDYNKETENQIITWDNKFNNFKEISTVTEVNKETFLTVTDIIMSNRKDGMNLAWKWNQENQQIPYEEFTIFYKELVQFSKERFQENINIERKKQSIAQAHNKTLETFPGIIYNYFLNIKPLEYKKGFVTKETKTLFNLK